MEIKDLKNFCSQNKAIETLCKIHSKNILLNILNRKGYTKFIDLFLKDSKLLIAFYKIDNLLRLNNLNIVKAFSLRKSTSTSDIYYLLTKFLLMNQKTPTKMFNEFTNVYSDLELAKKLVINRTSSIKDKTAEEISVLSEIIRYSFTNDFIPDEILERLKIESGFIGNLLDDWKNCFRKHINEMRSNTFYLDVEGHLAFFISLKSKRYESFTENEFDGNYTFKTLYFYCQKS